MPKIEERHGWDEEKEEFYLDGEYLCSTNHDEHGWSGMAMVRDTLKRLAEKAGFGYEVVYVEEE